MRSFLLAVVLMAATLSLSACSNGSSSPFVPTNGASDRGTQGGSGGIGWPFKG